MVVIYLTLIRTIVKLYFLTLYSYLIKFHFLKLYSSSYLSIPICLLPILFLFVSFLHLFLFVSSPFYLFSSQTNRMTRVEEKHKSKGLLLPMEDPWLGVDIPDDPSTLRLKKVRESVIYKEESKRRLLMTGFISTVDFTKGKSEVSLSCEVLCLLSVVFKEDKTNDKTKDEGKTVDEDKTKDEDVCSSKDSKDSKDSRDSKDSKDSKVQLSHTHTHPSHTHPSPSSPYSSFQRERERLLQTVPLIFSYLSKVEYPFTRHDISILRSLKNIILNLQYDVEPFLPFFLDLLLHRVDSPSVYAMKNELISLLCGVLEYKDIRESISSRRVIYVLNNPHLHSIGLLSLLLSPSNCQWVKIDHILTNLKGYSGRDKQTALSTVVRWYSFVEGRAYKPILSVLSKFILVDKACLLYFGRIVEGNLEAQEYAGDTGLLEKICSRYEKDIGEEVVYTLSTLVDSLETNRKYVAETNITPEIFNVFKEKCLRKEYDCLFKEILHFFTAMTRSILFLRSHLLDYPIVELLFDCLDEDQNYTNKVLRLLVNLVLEYGNYKKKFISNGGFERVLRFKESHPVEVLLIFKNYLYDTHWPSKELFVSATDQSFLNFFFQLFEEGSGSRQDGSSGGRQDGSSVECSRQDGSRQDGSRQDGSRQDGSRQDDYTSILPSSLNDYTSVDPSSLNGHTANLFLLETLFNLIRNLVCDDSLELILVSYDGLIPQVFKYLKIFSKEPVVYEKVLIQILYSIGNLSANSPSFRDLLFVDNRFEHLKSSCVTRDLQLAFVWIVINVSWKDEGYGERVEKLRMHGVREFLLRMNTCDSVLLDKINTALENIK